MAYPDAEALDWASAVLDTEVTVLRGLRHGGSPWLLRAEDREVILRVARAEQAAETATEVAAMTCVARVAGDILPVAELLAYDLAERTGYGLVLTACVPGTSVIPPEPDPKPPGTSCAAGRARRAGPRAMSPTGTPLQPSPPRRTWAGSRYRWPFRAVPTSPARSCSSAATPSSAPRSAS